MLQSRLGLWIMGWIPSLLWSNKNGDGNRLVVRLDGWTAQWTLERGVASLLRRC